MLFAVIGDIRGNQSAFEAVLDHIEEAGIHVLMHTGNAIVGGDGGDAVVDRLRARGVHCVQGLEDRLVVRFSKKRDALAGRVSPDVHEAMARAHAGTSSENLEFLRGLRKKQRLEMDGIAIALGHGLAGARTVTIGPGMPVARLRRLREEALADVVVLGGASEPFATTVDGALIVCPGPMEAGPGRARYALVCAEDPPWSATFPEVAYAAD